MARKVWLLTALAVLLLLAGCDGIDIHMEELQQTPSGDVASEGEEIPAGTAPAQTPSTPQGDSAAALSEEDFRIAVEGVDIHVGADPAAVFNAFGDGGADEDNNFGFIGWDDQEEHKFYRHDYDGFSIIVKTNVAESTSAISQIGITGVPTRRGIAPGDTYDDMAAQYGEPDAEKTDEGMTRYTYQWEDRTLIFITDHQGVIGYIEIL